MRAKLKLLYEFGLVTFAAAYVVSVVGYYSGTELSAGVTVTLGAIIAAAAIRKGEA